MNSKNRRKRQQPKRANSTHDSAKKPSQQTGAAATSKKGIYTEYLDRRMSLDQLNAERKKQLKRISELREGRAVLVYAADISKGSAGASTGLELTDIRPIDDQVAVLEGEKLDLILETPGGFGDVAEDIVKLLRHRFKEVNVIVPGTCKSAGTIIAMSADEILMDHVSSLGPIDAQIQHRGKQFSADALIQGLEDIKKEVKDTGVLNQALIPILQSLSPGELRHAENAMEFARELVTEWLFKYKFKNWTHRKRDGSEVTDDQKRARSEKISKALSDHGRWKTHSRSIKIDDLREMELEITDFSESEELADAIRRYKTLLDMTFKAMPAAYKMVETPTSQIVRSLTQQQLTPKTGAIPPMVNPLPGNKTGQGELTIKCPVCGTDNPVVMGLGEPVKKRAGFRTFPVDNKLACSNCGNIFDVKIIRDQIESQFGRKIQ